ncbi:MAG TPA: acetamidase/formamidase family protein [Gaiellaceae bacterium]
MNTDEVRVAFDEREPLRSGGLGHNRWHPDIAPIAHVQPGQDVVFRTRDGSDSQITREMRAPAFMAIDTDVIHALTGPFYVEGAEPGDLLRVEVGRIDPDDRGVTLVWPGSGFGMLPEDFDEPFIVHWEIHDGYARSAEMPGIAIAGMPFLGIMGVAPSHERLAEIAAREARLAESGFSVLSPDRRSAVPVNGAPATQGLRTAPPREIGGNMDIKQLTAGSVVTLPVDVPGALFSAGDCHFAQGDGEVTGTAIEITGTVRLRFHVVKPDEQRWRPRFPAFEYTETPRPMTRRYVGTTGIPVDAGGRNGYLDLTMAAKEAVREMIAYLTSTRGLTREQAYVLISVAGDLRISECVDVPNAIVSAHLVCAAFVATTTAVPLGWITIWVL